MPLRFKLPTTTKCFILIEAAKSFAWSQTLICLKLPEAFRGLYPFLHVSHLCLIPLLIQGPCVVHQVDLCVTLWYSHWLPAPFSSNFYVLLSTDAYQSKSGCVCVGVCVGEYKIRPPFFNMQKKCHLHLGHNRTFSFQGFYVIPKWTEENVYWDRTEPIDGSPTLLWWQIIENTAFSHVSPTHGVKGFPLGIPNHKHMLIPSY